MVDAAESKVGETNIDEGVTETAEEKEAREAEEAEAEFEAKHPKIQKRFDTITAEKKALEDQLESIREEMEELKSSKSSGGEKTWADLSEAELNAISLNESGEFSKAQEKLADREIFRRESSKNTESSTAEQEAKVAYNKSLVLAVGEYPDLEKPCELSTLANSYIIKKGYDPLDAARLAAHELGIMPKDKSEVDKLKKKLEKERKKTSLDTEGSQGSAGSGNRQSTLMKLAEEANKTGVWLKYNAYIKEHPEGSVREGTYTKLKR